MREKYLVAAIESDPNFLRSAPDLAVLREPPLADCASTQIQARPQMTPPTRPRAWREKHRPAAGGALLRELPAE